MIKNIFFKRELSYIRHDDIKALFIVCRDNAPDYFYCIPASTSGKYHAEYELGLGGLYRHSLGVARFMHHFLSIEQYAKEFTERKQDLLILGCCFHDVLKCGSNGSSFTVQDHSLRGAAYVREQNTKLKCPLQDEEINFVCAAMSSHMGEWNKSKSGKEILPKPETLAQQLVHLADLLASRKDLEVHFRIDEEFADEVIEPILNAAEFMMPFGKYKGESFANVKKDREYIQWLWHSHFDSESKFSLTEPLLTFVQSEIEGTNDGWDDDYEI